MYVYVFSILFFGYLFSGLENSIPEVKSYSKFYSIVSEMVTHVGRLHGLEPLGSAYHFRHNIFKVESKVSPIVE